MPHQKEGGFVDIATTPQLAGDGCEKCHGPGGTYVADDKMSLKNKVYKLADLLPLGLISPPTKETCEVCHNQRSPFVDDSYVFDFEERKSDGTHEHIPMKYEH